MPSKLFTLENLVITQTRSFLNDEFMITDERGVPVGTILQSQSLRDAFFNGSRSLEVATTDDQGNPQQHVLTIKDPPNFGWDSYEVFLPGIEMPLATITQKFSFFKLNLSLTMENFPDVAIEGSIWYWNLRITSQGHPVAIVDNQWKGFGSFLSGKNTYHLAIAEGLNEHQHAAILGATMAMDMLRTKSRQSD